MKIQLKRFFKNEECTIGKIYADNIFQCYSLEDRIRDKKIAHETAIPAGEYPVKLIKYGSIHERYKKDPRTAQVHDGMFLLENVPGYTDILIHMGLTKADTWGCILCGAEYDSEKNTLRNSSGGYLKLYLTMLAAAKRKETITIEVTDEAVFDPYNPEKSKG